MENEFEEYLQKQVNGYRMYPNNQSWRNINNQLHSKAKLTFATVACLFVIMLLLVVAEKQLTGLATTNFAIANYTPNRNATISPYSKQLAITNELNTVTLATPKNASNYNNSELINNATKTTLYNNQQNTIANKAIVNNSIIVNSTNDEALNTSNNKDNNDELNEISSNNIAYEPTTATPTPKVINEKQKVITISKNNTPIITTEPIKLVVAKYRKTVTQYYITPSLSYRRLIDENDIKQATSGTSLDKSVYHKPAMGLEFGVNLVRKLEPTVRFKTGLQLNYNRYNIKASAALPEVANYRLTGSSQNVQAISTLRNNDGLFPKWVENSNIQISIPVAFEFDIAGGEKSKLTIGTGLQPSYLLKNKNYVLSSDLKNYSEAPSLIRNLNVNANLETTLTIQAKGLRWQIGPQLRYQLLSTYKGKYPFKENLVDYGFKVGVSKSF